MRVSTLGLLFFILSSIFSLQAQQLEIIIDAQSGTRSYLQDEKPITNPVVKKGQDIVVKVVNYNNYLYDINIQESSEEKKIASNNNLLGGLDVMDIQSLMGTPDTGEVYYGEGEENYSPPGYSAEDVSAEKMAITQLADEARSELYVLEKLTNSFASTEMEVAQYRKREKFRGISMEEVNKLKYNARISPNLIKEQASIILGNALGADSYSKPTLSDIIENGNEDVALNALLTAHQKDQDNYREKVDKLGYIQTELSGLARERGDLIDLFYSMDKVITGAPKTFSKTEAITLSIYELMEVYKQWSMEDLMAIWYEYEAISSNTFTKTYQSQAKGDVTTFDITLTLKENAPASTDVPQTIQLAPLKIPVYGGIKINASIGINFAQFFDPPKTYYVRNDKIVGQEGDRFLPMVTSFMHFYKQANKDVSVGGSLGIGIPVGGGDGFASTNFFLGPSFFFGRSDRFVLNMGIMGGKTNTLSLGFEEGDIFDGIDDFIPTQSVYELGYFLGLSFNLTN